MVEMRRRAAAVAACALLAGFLAAAPAGASSATTRANELNSMLLGLAVAGHGWTAEPITPGAGVGCLARALEPSGVHETASAGVYFVDDGSLPSISEKLATYREGGRTAYRAIVRALDACRTVRAAKGSTSVSGTVRLDPFTGFGDASSSYAVRLDVGGTRITEQVLIAQKGSIVMALSSAALGSVDLVSFRLMATDAVSLLP